MQALNPLFFPLSMVLFILLFLKVPILLAPTFRYVLGSTFYMFHIYFVLVILQKKRLTLCFLCLLPNLALKQESLKLGAPLIRYIIFLVLENAAEKCTSPCVEIFAPVKSATNIVIQPTCERNTTWTNLLPITSVKCQGPDSPGD